MRRSKPSGPPKSLKNRGGSTTLWTTPRPTDVLSYSYLWHREAMEGREEGIKDRPVVVVVARKEMPHGTELLVVPVTTRPPREGDPVVELPARVRDHLGLGEARSWIVANELNRFTWPGPDIRPVRQGTEASPRYGSIPGKLFDMVRDRIREEASTGRLRIVNRTE